MYEDVTRADRIVCDLAALLRQALNAQENGRHSLAQELDLIQPYLAIMQARFGERLQVELAVSEAALACFLPSLLLIAPVENAITHDVAHSAGRCGCGSAPSCVGAACACACTTAGRAPAA